jgi:hypothetical protein
VGTPLPCATQLGMGSAGEVTPSGGQAGGVGARQRAGAARLSLKAAAAFHQEEVVASATARPCGA